MSTKLVEQGFRAGNLVRVRSPGEVLRTLDADGTLDGLPFMPEMGEFCGRQFRVLRRVEKTCCETPQIQMGAFERNDVVLLDRLRCSGVEHGGCQVAHMIFWKEAWLSNAGEKEPLACSDGASSLRLRLVTRAGHDRGTSVRRLN